MTATVYAHVGKSNLASSTAATHAGYTIKDASGRELIMVWRRPGRRR
jgi:hypothetical protein